MCDTSQRIVFLDLERFYFWPFFLFTILTGVQFLQSFDKCIFKIAAWQLMIKAVNNLSHPHTHYVTIRSTQSEGPGCEQTGVEDKAFGAIWLLSACSTSSRLMGSFVVQLSTAISYFKGCAENQHTSRDDAHMCCFI